MHSTREQPEDLRHIQAELGQALADLGLADDGPDAPADRGSPPGSAHVEGLPPGALIGRFSVLQRVGRGGQGDVYAAYDPQLDRRVAVKLIRSAHGDPTPNIRLMREAQALAQLEHPNVIRVHEAGNHGSAAYIVMEFKTSQSLAHWLAEAPRTWREILAKFLAAGRGLRAAHEKGIVHRDVKAANIFVDAHVGAVLGDFGLAYGLEDDASSDGPADETGRTLSESRRSSALRVPLTDKGQFPGTEGYIAPEAMSGRATARSDQYSFCVAVFHALFGVMARPDESRHPARPGDNVPPEIVKALHRGLARAPDARFADMGDLLAALAVEPRRRGLTAFAGVAVALAVGWLVWPRGADPCLVAAQNEARPVWNAERRSKLGAAFAAVDLPFARRTGQSFLEFADDYTSRWTAARASTCAAPTPAAASCLEHQRDRFDNMLTAYEAPDRQLVTFALDVASRLTSPAQCLTHAAALTQKDIPEGIRRRMDRAEFLIAGGDFAAARREIEDLQRVPKDSPAHPRVLYLTGWLAGASEPDRRSDALLDDALHAALRTGDDDTFARAALYRLKSLVLDLGEPAEAATLERWVDSSMTRWQPDTLTDWIFRADLAEARGFRLEGEQEFMAAAEQHRHALDMRRDLFGDGHTLVAKSHHNLAVSLAYLRETSDEARRHYREAYKIRIARLGETHPESITTAFGLAQVDCEYFAALVEYDPAAMADCVDDLAGALEHYQQHPTLDRRGLPRRAVTLANHAIDAGCDECAETALEFAETVLADLRDVDPHERSDVLAVRGKLEASRGALAEAYAAFLAGAELWEKADRRDQAYFQHLGNITSVAANWTHDAGTTAWLLARAPALLDARCPARLAYAAVLDEHARALGPARAVEELAATARTARTACI